MLKHFPAISSITSTLELDQVIDAARADGDNIIHPSHKVVKNGEIVGAASLAVIPLVLLWQHTKKFTPRDSGYLKLTYDALMDTKGAKNYFIACNKHSPYNSHMKQMGFKPVRETEIFTGGTAVNNNED